MLRKTTRREFLKHAAATGAGVAAASIIPASVDAANSANSRVIIVRNSNVLRDSETPGNSVNVQTLASMLDQGIAKLMKRQEAASAWKTLFKPSDIVGIKVNCLFGPAASTRKEVAFAVAEGLMKAGVKPENIIIWDRSSRDLIKCGYRINRDGDGIKVIANDGVWEDNPTKAGEFEGRLTRIVTEQITALVNIPFMKDHSIAGISGALKNHYGTHDNPARHHPNNCDPFLAELNTIPAIKNKTRLVVMDALRPMCNGGPRLHKEFLWNWHGLVISQDPLALDYTAWQVIEARRKEIGLESLEEAGRPPKWMATAARLGVGTNDPSRMEVIRLG